MLVSWIIFIISQTVVTLWLQNIIFILMPYFNKIKSNIKCSDKFHFNIAFHLHNQNSLTNAKIITSIFVPNMVCKLL